jgi:hypothetical protein
MIRRTRALILLALLGHAAAARAGEVVQAGPWELHSSFWMSLHQTLIEDAMSTPPRSRPELSGEELAAWNAAVTAYRMAGGRGDMTFATPMVITTDGLTQVADDATDPIIDAPLKDALMQAAPVYRRHWWTADDRASRFFISYAASLLRDAGESLVKAHETVYRTPWPQRVRAYVTPSAGPFGAYTMDGKAGGVITTMSCRDAGYQGFRALEMLLHESSHAVVTPSRGTVGAAITAAAKQRGIDAPRDLWHAILFTTSGELTRRLLVERGVAGFVPSSEELLTRAWPTFREPIEKNWYPYLSGQGTLEEAIDKVVASIPK